MKDLLELFVRGLVSDPRRVVVRETSVDDGIEFLVEVAPGDRGRVIGRGGRTVDALRTLMAAVADRRGGPACFVEVAD
jgi:predicted RNA-binding protein YlqC (UPF0109 family)